MSAIDCDGNMVHSNFTSKAVTKTKKKKRARPKAAFFESDEEDDFVVMLPKVEDDNTDNGDDNELFDSQASNVLEAKLDDPRLSLPNNEMIPSGPPPKRASIYEPPKNAGAPPVSDRIVVSKKGRKMKGTDGKPSKACCVLF